MVKDAILSAEIFNLLANEQYGSQLYSAAIYLETNKRLVYEVSRQMKKKLRFAPTMPDRAIIELFT